MFTLPIKYGLALAVTFALLGYSAFYFNNGVTSGDHWKFLHTVTGLFVFVLVFLWAINLNRSAQQRNKANKIIKIALIIAVGLVITAALAFSILFAWAMSGASK